MFGEVGDEVMLALKLVHPLIGGAVILHTPLLEDLRLVKLSLNLC